MISYAPGDSPAHRLDPRTKLGFQAAFALAAFAHTTPRGLAVLTVVALGVLAASRTPLLGTVRAYRAFLPFLVAGPLLAAVTLRPPYVVPEAAVYPALSSYRVVLVLLVSTAYIRTTPVRDSRAAIQRVVPGRVGVLLGAGVGFVLRFLPLLKRDLTTIRSAMDARLGDRRGLYERIRLIAETGLRRLFLRSDRFALALQARCFAWNPTLPELSFSRADVAGLAATAALVAAAFV
ncbi:energy-coupling factor transporter transmembrane component T family protein [Halopelagius longus]|uniref:Biotin transport system permease protein n=1 Tax=Halopelagius longus TaxID=1236180 RepID=A0A1H1E981_9EURY|nr:energy-coupling factor transporter transmembrane component T [Halopelagius longus]RDI71652.1 energy-coupling factor transporter transmembrane protein EcfT [Halopelagius longus]SDQ85068.1 biotin transport system permease protein [Halopelagius longus]